MSSKWTVVIALAVVLTGLGAYKFVAKYKADSWPAPKIDESSNQTGSEEPVTGQPAPKPAVQSKPSGSVSTPSPSGSKTTTTQPPKTTTTGGEIPKTVVVKISGYAFTPAVVQVKKGTQVLWLNEDSVGHTVTNDNGTGPGSGLLVQGQSYAFTFDKAGDYPYHCQPHPYMRGAVVVVE